MENNNNVTELTENENVTDTKEAAEKTADAADENTAPEKNDDYKNEPFDKDSLLEIRHLRK